MSCVRAGKRMAVAGYCTQKTDDNWITFRSNSVVLRRSNACIDACATAHRRRGRSWPGALTTLNELLASTMPCHIAHRAHMLWAINLFKVALQHPL
eukprot:3948370-Prymnesium_polylepis.1